MNAWPMLLGWPAIALSAAIAVVGFRRGRPLIVMLALLPILPVGLYLLGSPRFWWLPVAAVMLVIALALRTGREQPFR